MKPQNQQLITNKIKLMLLAVANDYASPRLSNPRWGCWTLEWNLKLVIEPLKSSARWSCFSMNFYTTCRLFLQQQRKFHCWTCCTGDILSLSSWERLIPSQMFVEAVCKPMCSILYPCGHESDWNPEIQWFKCVSVSPVPWTTASCVLTYFPLEGDVALLEISTRCGGAQLF